MSERTVIHSIGQEGVVNVPPSTPVPRAARVMSSGKCSSVLVTGSDGALLGILTASDLLTRVLAASLDPERTVVADVMTRHPYCVPPDTTVTDAMLAMMERGIRHLPVVDQGQTVLGVFTLRDAQPAELSAAIGLAEFRELVADALNDALA